MDAGRLRSVARIAVFDIAGPLLAYNLLRANGFSTVAALVLSGVFPAAGVIIGIIGHRRVDAVGVLVLAGIAAGAVIGLVSHNPKLVLDEGSVGTAVFGLLCLGSLARPEPMMYRLAMEFIGPDSQRARVHRAVAVPGVPAHVPGDDRRLGQRLPSRGRGPGHHRGEHVDRDCAGLLQGDAVCGGRRAGRLDGRLRPTAEAAGGGTGRGGGRARRR